MDKPFLILGFVLALVVALAVACGTGDPSREALSTEGLRGGVEIYYWHDDARNVGCWVTWRNSGGLAIHCISDGQY